MSYKQSQGTYPYFCNSAGDSNTNTSINVILDNNSIVFNSTNLERGSDNFTNCKFTAPIKGLYYFEIILNCFNNSAYGDDTGVWGFAIKKGTEAETYRLISDNPGYFSETSIEYTTRFSTIVNLNVGDYVRGASNGFDDAERYITNQNYFTGYLIAAFN